MASDRKSDPQDAGRDFLVRKSDLAKTRKDLPAIKDILIVEDKAFDSDRLTATLRVMFGYEVEVRRAKTLTSALDCVFERQPELIFLDDYLDPSDTANESIPILRRAKYQGPIIIISSEVDRFRRAELLAKGASETINKDELNSVAIADVLAKVMKAGKSSAT